VGATTSTPSHNAKAKRAENACRPQRIGAGVLGGREVIGSSESVDVDRPGASLHPKAGRMKGGRVVAEKARRCLSPPHGEADEEKSAGIERFDQS
jgi:hypothetical protein